MRLPPRGTPLLPGTFTLPEPFEEGERLVFREPVRETLVPFAAVATLGFSCCVGVASTEGFVQVVLLVLAAGFCFLGVALLSSLRSRPEVVCDRGAGVLRFRRPEHGPMEIPAADVRAVTLETVKGAAAAGGFDSAPAAGLELKDGGWLPLHVAWAPARGGDAARARARGEAFARWLGVPLEERAGPAVAGPAVVVE